MQPAISAVGLVREFSQRPGRQSTVWQRLAGRSQTFRAVDNISLAVQDGDTVGFLGANGAGKSTTIKLLSGLLLPTSGTVSIHGLDPWRNRKKCAHLIGVVFGQRSQLVYDTPLIASFGLIRDLYAIPRPTFQNRLSELVELLDAEAFLDRPVRSLSLGQRMRGDLIASLLPAPRVLFLDEPTIGLDIIAKRSIYGFLDRLRTTGDTTTLLTSHDMRDIERLCERLVVINDGRTIYDGTVPALRSELQANHTVVAELAPGQNHSPDEIERLTLALRGVSAAEVKETAEAARLIVKYDTTDISTATLVGQLLTTFDLTDLSMSTSTLDDVIEMLYRRLEHLPSAKNAPTST